MPLGDVRYYCYYCDCYWTLLSLESAGAVVVGAGIDRMDVAFCFGIVVVVVPTTHYRDSHY